MENRIVIELDCALIVIMIIGSMLLIRFNSINNLCNQTPSLTQLNNTMYSLSVDEIVTHIYLWLCHVMGVDLRKKV